MVLAMHGVSVRLPMQYGSIIMNNEIVCIEGIPFFFSIKILVQITIELTPIV